MEQNIELQIPLDQIAAVNRALKQIMRNPGSKVLLEILELIGPYLVIQAEK